MRVVDGLLYVVSEKSLAQEVLLVAPAGVRQKFLSMSHDAKELVTLASTEH